MRGAHRSAAREEALRMYIAGIEWALPGSGYSGRTAQDRSAAGDRVSQTQKQALAEIPRGAGII